MVVSRQRVPEVDRRHRHIGGAAGAEHRTVGDQIVDGGDSARRLSSACGQVPPRPRSPAHPHPFAIAIAGSCSTTAVERQNGRSDDYDQHDGHVGQDDAAGVEPKVPGQNF